MLQTHSYYTYTLDYLLSKTKHQTPGFHMDVIQLEAEKHVMPCANVPCHGAWRRLSCWIFTSKANNWLQKLNWILLDFSFATLHCSVQGIVQQTSEQLENGESYQIITKVIKFSDSNEWLQKFPGILHNPWPHLHFFIQKVCEAILDCCHSSRIYLC